jgi:AcrR family transcriptional regulator
MGRPKLFSREDVLTKAISVFWQKGFAETSLQDLERETGVNKSGLYTEFKNKEDIFLESLRFYLSTRGGDDLLSAQPLGWDNIQRFLQIGQPGHRSNPATSPSSLRASRTPTATPPISPRASSSSRPATTASSSSSSTGCNTNPSGLPPIAKPSLPSAIATTQSTCKQRSA